MMARLSILFSLFTLFCIPGRAQDSIRFESNVPHLNGHYFVSNALTLGAFTNTAFSQSLGVGISTPIAVPTLTLGDLEVELPSGQLLYAQLTFDYSQRIQDWVSFYINIGGAGRFGTNPSSLLTQGLNTAIGTRMGWKIRIIEKQKHFLSGSIGISNVDAGFVNVLGFVQDVLDSADSPALVQDVSVLQGNLGLQYAYAISPVFGIQSSGKLSYGDSFEEGKSAFEYGIALALDANLYPRTNIPVGISLGLAYASLPEFSVTAEGNSFFFSSKLAYTAAEHLLFGLDFTTYQTELGIARDATKFSSETRVSSFTLNMTYYFN